MSSGGEIRRVVTTHDETGKAIVLSDRPTPYKTVRQDSGITSRLIWVTDRTPADISSPDDRGGAKIGIAPPIGGSVFRFVDFPPASEEMMAKLDPELMAKQVGEGHAAGRAWPPRHPFMHRTRTCDYAIVMSGEIDMLLDDSEIHLKAGDVLVQQGTNHAWVNRGTEPCRIAFVLIDAVEPLD